MSRILMTLGFVVLVSTSTFAQNVGDTDQVTHGFTPGISTGPIQFDPNAQTGAATRTSYARPLDSSQTANPDHNQVGRSVVTSLVNSVFGVPSEIFDFINGAGDFFGANFNFGMSTGVTGSYAGYFEVDSISDGSVDLQIPTQVPVVYPAPNTFGCGTQVEVFTQSQYPGSSMSVESPFYNLEVGGQIQSLNLSVGAFVHLDACVGIPDPYGGCIGHTINATPGGTLLNQPLPVPPAVPLINFCDAAFLPGATDSTLASCTQPGFTNFFILGQTALDGYNASHGTNHHLAQFTPTSPAGPGMVLLQTPDLAGGPPLPEMEGTFIDVSASPLTFSSLNGGRLLRSNGTMLATAEMGLDLVSLLEYAGIPTGFSLGGGVGSVDVGDIQPTLTVEQDMRFDFAPSIPILVDLGSPMSWSVHNPGGGLSHAGNGQIVGMVADQSLRVTFPQTRDTPTDVQNTYGMQGQFSALTSQAYFESVKVNVLKLAAGGLTNFTALSYQTAKQQLAGSPKVLENHTQALLSPDSLAAAPFALDPEHPVIELPQVHVAGVRNLGNGERAVVYRFAVENAGDVELRGASALRDFQQTFGTASSYAVQCLHSDDGNENLGFDGNADIEMLATATTLAVGQTSLLDTIVNVRPEISPILAGGCFGVVSYDATCSAAATSPIGTPVTDRYDHCRDLFRSPEITASVNLGAAVLDELSDYTIYGWRRVDLVHGMLASRGHVGTSGDVRTKRSKNVGVPTILGDLHVGDDLSLVPGGLVVDYLQVGDKTRVRGSPNDFVVNGARSLGSSCVATFPRDLLPDRAPKRWQPRTVLSEGSTTTLPPDAYGEIWLRKNSELRLESGEYDINRFKILDDGAKIIFDVSDGPIAVYLDNWHMIGKGHQFVVENGATSDVTIHYAGKHRLVFRESLLQATIIAPGALVRFEAGSVLQGACYADAVRMGSGSRFLSHADVALPPLTGACENLLPPL